MQTDPTSPLLRREVRSEQTALRHIMNRRAQAVALVFHNLNVAAQYRRYLMAPASPMVAAYTLEEAQARIRSARVVRLSSTMGERLP